MMSDAASLLQRIGGNAATKQLVTLNQQVEQASQALASNYAAEASQTAQAASAQLISLKPLLDRLHTAEAKIAETEHTLNNLPVGKHRDDVTNLVEEGRTALRTAAATIGTPDATQAVTIAEDLADRAYQLGPDFANAQQQLQGRLATLSQRGSDMNARLEQGRQEFDIVDDYAPDSWSDIRGNGSEATAAVNQAHQLWQSAQQKISANDWSGAISDVDTAEARLDYADTLLTAITTRLADLRTAQQNGERDLEDAKRDIKLGWGYVRNNDADVGKEPEQALQQAEQLLAAVERTIQNAKPNWIAVVRDLTNARQLADKALAGARSEVEVMQAKRDQAQSLAQASAAEYNKLTNFAKLHPADVSNDQERRIQQIGRLVAQGDEHLSHATRSEEDERAVSFQAAIQAYNQAIDESAPLYSAMYESFQSLEALRKEASEAVQVATQSISNANAWYSQYAYVMPAGSQGQLLLNQAQQILRPYNPNDDERGLKLTAEKAKEANGLAHQAATMIQQAAQQYQRTPMYGRGRNDGSMGDLLTGMMLGQLMGGGHRHHGGWGGGYGGGWGGGSGGGHSGGSIFGGGGGGGFFGGSGDSGGDWGGGGSIFGGGGDSGGGWGGGDSGSGDSGGSW